MAVFFHPIAAQTLASDSASIIFTNIPQSFTDLKIVVSARHSNSGPQDNIYFRFNQDSSALYSDKGFYHAATGIFGYSTVSAAQALMIASNGDTSLANTSSNVEIYVSQYKNTSIFKSFMLDGASLNNATTYEAKRHTIQSGIYRSTNAINSVTLGGWAGNLKAGTTAILYGIL
jgi:hypothetical protein